MLCDIEPSRLYTASCCEDNNDHTGDTTGAENMTQPLIMSNASLEDEEQRMLSRKRQIRGILCKSFSFGSFIGFAFQAMSFAACHTLLKLFGKDPKPTPGSFLSSFPYFTLVLLSQLDLALYVAIWLTYAYSITKSGSLYIRKKFDKDAADPSSGSIWTASMLFIAEICFLFGATIGCLSLLMIMALCTGMVETILVPFITMMIDLVLIFIAAKWFAPWICSGCSTTEEQELEDDSCFIVARI